MTGILRCVSETRGTACRISFKELHEEKVALRMVDGNISCSIKKTQP